MGTNRVIQPQSREGAAEPGIVYGSQLADFKAQIQDAIAHRAYEFFEARGHSHGADLEDWFRSEAELLHPLEVKTWESPHEITVTAEIPGFLPEELRIGIEPRSVTLWGQVGPHPSRTSAYPARAPVTLLHTIELPAEVDPRRASAKFSGSLLKLILPKSEARQASV
jgi:HSP20 family molecular chaperone IbpA